MYRNGKLIAKSVEFSKAGITHLRKGYAIKKGVTFRKSKR